MNSSLANRLTDDTARPTILPVSLVPSSVVALLEPFSDGVRRA